MEAPIGKHGVHSKSPKVSKACPAKTDFRHRAKKPKKTSDCRAWICHCSRLAWRIFGICQPRVLHHTV